ncbi:MAG: hypothetical protein RLY40_473 [Pseudomonadota bacterium]|jgi:hypothetical protein
MPLPTEIQDALKIYDTKKGRWRKLFHYDQAAIRALRKLSKKDQTDLLKIYQCFIQKKPKATQESYNVYLALLDYLADTGYCGIPETLNQLHNNKLLHPDNLNKLSELEGSHFLKLASLFPLLSSRGLLIQTNFDKIAEYFKIITENRPEELNNIVEAIKLLQIPYLTQENLNCVFEQQPQHAVSMVRILKILGTNGLLTSDNRIALSKANNQFLLSNHAYYIIWDRLEFYLPTTTDNQKNQLLFDHLIYLTQQKDPNKKIEAYINSVIPKEDKPPRRYTYSENKFPTEPPARSKSRGSLNHLVNLAVNNRGSL